MKEFTHIVTDKEGIHARPAGLLVKEAKSFQSAVTLRANGRTGDAKKIFTIMALAAKQGCELRVTVEGPDEDAAAAAVERFLKENL